ncbi:MAG: hypothetical protein M3R43_10500 [Acidobacteriota bacterium]|nr:hypothetical protein [Acidobacteriota bacterium]
MEPLLAHSIALVCVTGVFFVGRYFTKNPEQMLHAFSFGSDDAFPSLQRFGVGYFKVVGKFFQVFSVIGAVMFCGVIVFDLFKHR